MRKQVLLIAVLVAGGSCAGAPPEPQNANANPPKRNNTDGMRPIGQVGDFRAHVQTIDDWAKERGVHVGYVLLANQACARFRDCERERDPGREPIDQSVCEDRALDVWCKRFDCKQPEEVEHGPPWRACSRAAMAQPCSQLEQPISCEVLDSRGIKVRSVDFREAP